MENIIKRMQDRIMEHQKENGFETIFDFLNDDISDIEEKRIQMESKKQFLINEMQKLNSISHHSNIEDINPWD